MSAAKSAKSSFSDLITPCRLLPHTNRRRDQDAEKEKEPKTESKTERNGCHHPEEKEELQNTSKLLGEAQPDCWCQVTCVKVGAGVC